jgi:hypothetical protein
MMVLRTWRMAQGAVPNAKPRTCGKSYRRAQRHGIEDACVAEARLGADENVEESCYIGK